MNKLDKLAAELLLDQVRDLINSDSEEKTMLQEFEEWIDKLHGVGDFKPNGWCVTHFYDPSEYAEVKTIHRLVSDLFFQKHGDKKYIQEHRHDVMHMIQVAVFMTMFIKGKIDSEKIKRGEA